MLIVGGFTIEENIFSVSIINVSSQKKINFGRSKRSWNTTIGWRTKAKYFEQPFAVHPIPRPPDLTLC